MINTSMMHSGALFSVLPNPNEHASPQNSSLYSVYLLYQASKKQNP